MWYTKLIKCNQTHRLRWRSSHSCLPYSGFENSLTHPTTMTKSKTKANLPSVSSAPRLVAAMRSGIIDHTVLNTIIAPTPKKPITDIVNHSIIHRVISHPHWSVLSLVYVSCRSRWKSSHQFINWLPGYLQIHEVSKNHFTFLMNNTTRIKQYLTQRWRYINERLSLGDMRKYYWSIQWLCLPS